VQRLRLLQRRVRTREFALELAVVVCGSWCAGEARQLCQRRDRRFLSTIVSP